MLPLLAPLAIGAGGALFNHLFKPGQTRMREEDFDYDPDRLARREYERLSDPNYGAAQFGRLASQGSIGAAGLSQFALSRGGSVAQGAEMAQASQSRANDSAFQQFGQFRLGADQAAQGALGMDLDRQRFVREGMAQQSAQNAGASGSFMNNVMGGLGYYMGNRYGGGGRG